MGSSYLRGADELAAFNVPSATDAQITLASAFVDAYLGRPEGLIWLPDAAGRPALMDALEPPITLTLTGTIEPGVSQTATFTGPTFGNAGDVVILDRADPSKCEACQISAVSPGIVTFANVQFEHLDGATVDFGLVIVEERKMPEDRPICMVSRPNMVALLGGQGRYAYGRRGGQNRYSADEFNLLASVGQFGGPPQWVVFNPASADFNATTGEVWIPTGVMLAYFSETRLQYVAGFTPESLPYVVKQATANVIQAKGNNDALNGNIQTLTMGSTRITRFSNTLMDDDTKLMLKPYRARRFG
jgi:hypothetical protein